MNNKFKKLILVFTLIIFSTSTYSDNHLVLFPTDLKKAMNTDFKRIYMDLGYDKWFYNIDIHQKAWNDFSKFWNNAENALHNIQNKDSIIGKKLICKTNETGLDDKPFNETHAFIFVPAHIVLDEIGKPSKAEFEVLSFFMQDTSRLPYFRPGFDNHAILLGLKSGYSYSISEVDKIHIQKLGSNNYMSIDRRKLTYSYQGGSKIGKCQFYDEQWEKHHGHIYDYFVSKKIYKDLYKTVLDHIKKIKEKKSKNKI